MLIVFYCLRFVMVCLVCDCSLDWCYCCWFGVVGAHLLFVYEVSICFILWFC